MQTVAPPGNATRIVAAVSALVDAQSRGTDRANKQLWRLRVAQIAGEDEHIQRHHRHHAKYNQVFHAFRSFDCQMKSEAPLSAAPCVRRSLDMGGPSDRNCSRRRLRSRGVGAWLGPCRATAAWALWFRRVTRELFSSVPLSGSKLLPSR